MEYRNLVTPARLFAGFLLVGIGCSAASLLPGGGSPIDLMISTAQAAEETPKDILAAQIRTQGFACDQPLRATRDAKRSRPDRAVWVLTCRNATYRISRAPDMAARVERLE